MELVSWPHRSCGTCSSGILGIVGGWFGTDILEHCANPIIMGQHVQDEAWPLKMGPTHYPEVSVTNYALTLEHSRRWKTVMLACSGMELIVIFICRYKDSNFACLLYRRNVCRILKLLIVMSLRFTPDISDLL
jgi:hypothetical protein